MILVRMNLPSAAPSKHEVTYRQVAEACVATHPVIERVPDIAALLICMALLLFRSQVEICSPGVAGPPCARRHRWNPKFSQPIPRLLFGLHLSQTHGFVAKKPSYSAAEPECNCYRSQSSRGVSGNRSKSTQRRIFCGQFRA